MSDEPTAVNERLRLAVFGLGIAGNRHALHALESSDFELCAVSDPDEEKLDAWRERGVACYRHSDELLKEQTLDAVVVASPHAFHHAQTLSALEHGCHVMVEKPMAMSVVECDEMIERARQQNRELMVAHTRHFLPAYRQAKREIEAGRIGRPLMALDPFFSEYVTDRRPKWYLEKSARGMFWNVGLHSIDRLRWLLGTTEKLVSAHITRHDAIDLGAAILLRYENGASATVTMAGFSTSVPLALHLIGDCGTLRLSYNALDVKSRDQSDSAFEPVEFPEKPDATDLQFAEFAASIAEDRAPAPDGTWGRDIIAVAEAVYESSETGTTVTPDLSENAGMH